MNKTLILIFTAAFASAVSLSANAKGDAATGAEKAKTVCAACHGPDGNTPVIPGAPRIAGQHYDYLLHTLKAYKSGERKNPIMTGQVQALSIKDMEDLAAYYAAQDGSLYLIKETRGVTRVDKK